MGDVILSALTDTTTPTADALVYVLDNPSGSPSDRKVTIANIQKVSGGRELLTANRIYYVRTDGSNANDGLTNSAGGAFLTVQKAIDVLSTAINLGGYNVTIQIADGTYVGDNTVNSPWDGVGTVTISGNSGTPDNVILTPATTVGSGICSRNGGRIIITDLKIYHPSAGFGVYARSNGYIGFSNITFATQIQIRADDNSNCESLGANRIAAGSYYYAHLYAMGNSTLTIAHDCTLSGTPTFTNFASVASAGTVNQTGTYIGSATGRRYYVSTGGKIFSADSETVFPGNVVGILYDSGGSFYGTSWLPYLYLTSDETRTSSTVLAAMASLGAGVFAGHRYAFTFKAYTTSNVGGGVKFSMNGTATATSIVYEGRLWSGGTCTQTRGAALNDVVCAVTAVTAAYVEISGTIVVNASGTLMPYFAQNASNGAASTALSGSLFEVRRLL